MATEGNSIFPFLSIHLFLKKTRVLPKDYRDEMKAEGMAGEVQVNLDDFMGKDFVTFRKTKNYSEVQYTTKYNFLNLVNKHYTRRQDDILTQVSE